MAHLGCVHCCLLLQVHPDLFILERLGFGGCHCSGGSSSLAFHLSGGSSLFVGLLLFSFSLNNFACGITEGAVMREQLQSASARQFGATSSCLSATKVQHTLLLPAFNKQLGFCHRLLRNFLHMRRPARVDAHLMRAREQASRCAAFSVHLDANAAKALTARLPPTPGKILQSMDESLIQCDSSQPDDARPMLGDVSRKPKCSPDEM